MQNFAESLFRGMALGQAERDRRRQEEARNALASAIQTGGYDSPQAMHALAALEPVAAMTLGFERADRKDDLAHRDRIYELDLRQFEEGTRRWEAQFALQRAAAARAAAAGDRAAMAAAEEERKRGILALAQGVSSLSDEDLPTGYRMALQAALRSRAISEDALERLPPLDAGPQEIRGWLMAQGIGAPQRVEPPRMLSGPERRMYGIPDDDPRPFVLDPVTKMAKPAVAGVAAPTDPLAALRARAEAAGLREGTEEYREFMRAGGRVEPSRAIFGPDGQPILLEGGATTQRFTEQQSKDVVYATRAEGALRVLDQYASALTSFGERVLDADPTGLARSRQSPEFQLARQAGDEFLQAILRKDTGAAITRQEQELYGDTYLPRPGDNAAVLAQKQQARRRALEALKAGMGPAQILAQERALQRTIETRSEPSVDDLLRKYSE